MQNRQPLVDRSINDIQGLLDKFKQNQEQQNQKQQYSLAP